MINKSTFDKVFLAAVEQLKKFAPKRTGNLASSIKYRWISENQFEIYIDVGDTDAFVRGAKFDKGLAPYTPFTNEMWISPRWNGKKNPNENWWNYAVEYVIDYIARCLGGELE